MNFVVLNGESWTDAEAEKFIALLLQHTLNPFQYIVKLVGVTISLLVKDPIMINSTVRPRRRFTDHK
ncbi:hypothetical protein, partial [Frankia sp. AvcI1]